MTHFYAMTHKQKTRAGERTPAREIQIGIVNLIVLGLG